MPSRMLSIFALLAAGVPIGYAQTSGSIAGGVVDSTQASVLGASVRIKDDSKGFTQSTVTDREGRFVFLQLSPGTYTLEVEAKGFKTGNRTGFGAVTSVRPPRNMQISARFQF